MLSVDRVGQAKRTARQFERQAGQQQPGAGLELSLDGLVYVMPQYQQLLQSAARDALAGLLHQRFALAPDFLPLAQGVIGYAGSKSALYIQQAAYLAGQGPKHQGRFNAFLLQHLQDFLTAGGVAHQYGIAEGKNIITGAVRYRLNHLFCIDGLSGVEQVELVQLLLRRQQVALDAGAQQLQGVSTQAESLRRRSLRKPLRQLLRFNRPDLDDQPALFHLLVPGAFFGAGIQSIGLNQKYIVRCGVVQIALQQATGLFVRLLAAQAQLDDLAFGKQ